MDLPYPSIRQSKSMRQSTQRLFRSTSIKLSALELPKLQKLSSVNKKVIIKYLKNDQPSKLSLYLEQQVINFDSEIGDEKSYWNILHFCVRFNACQCLKYILKTQYQLFADQYEYLVNLTTIQGYTPLIISVIQKSNECFNILLDYGGSDIYTIDGSRMTAYQLAIKYKNNYASQKLLERQKNYHQKNKINFIKLTETIVFVQKQSQCCSHLFRFFRQFFSFGYIFTNQLIQPSIITKAIDIIKLDEIGKIDKDYEIQWIYAEKRIEGCKQLVLFDRFNASDIHQQKISLKNNLIILQALSQFPQQLKNKIYQNKKNKSQYLINLYLKGFYKVISTDTYIPSIKNTKQPIFIDDVREIWPIIIQKAMAKAHGSYMELDNVSAKQFLTQVTGFYTSQLSFTNFENPYKIICELNQKKYLYLLCIKMSKLKNLKTQRYARVLKFNNNYNKNLILVSGTQIDQKQQQMDHNAQLQQIKNHHNWQKQPCIWIQQNKIQEYFEGILYTMILPNLKRIDIKIISEEYIFFKLKVNKLRQEKIAIQFLNNENGDVYNISAFNFNGWVNEGKSYLNLIQRSQYQQKIALLYHNSDNYLCKFQLPTSQSCSKLKKQNDITLTCWSIDGLYPQILQYNFGIIEWFLQFKNYVIANWNYNLYAIQKLAECCIIITRHLQLSQMQLKIEVKEDDILEGSLNEKGNVQLIRQQKRQEFFYCIIKGIFDDIELIFQ